MHNHEQLQVWRRSRDLAVIVCREIGRTRVRRHRSLMVQLERSIVSVPSNIAEGAGQSTDVQFSRFLTIAIASANESVSHIALIEGLNLLPGRDCPGWREELIAIRRMVYGLQRWLKTHGER